MLPSQLWEWPGERAITNKRTVKETVWGLQLTAPVRAPMRVFNKMSSEARVTVPKPLSLCIFLREDAFSSRSRIKITYFVCVSVTIWHLEGRGSYNWKQWCQLIKSLQAVLYKTSKFTALSRDCYLKHGQTLLLITQFKCLYFLYLHTTNTQQSDREALSLSMCDGIISDYL